MKICSQHPHCDRPDNRLTEAKMLPLQGLASGDVSAFPDARELPANHLTMRYIQEGQIQIIQFVHVLY